MIIFLVLSTIVLIILRILQNDNTGLKISMFLIFIFLSLRYGYGNDYMGYIDIFASINDDFKTILSDPGRLEIGWIMLNRLFYAPGFNVMIVFLALVNCITYYRFIAKFVENKYYWFAVFIYLLNSNLFLIQLSAMRQTVAIIIFINAVIYIYNKKYIIAFILMCTCYLFHTSSLLLIPLVLIVLFSNFNVKIIHIIIIEILFITLFMSGEALRPNFDFIVTLFFNEQYDFYLNSDVESKANFVNIVAYSLLIFVLLLNYNTLDWGFKIFTKLLILGVFFLPLGFIIPISSRLALYLLPLSIVIYPKYMDVIESRLIRNLFIVGIMLIILVRLISFFNSDTYGEYYMEYSTIFSSL